MYQPGRQRNNVEVELSGKRSLVVALIRLLVFSMVVIVCLAAGSLLYFRWRDARLGQMQAPRVADIDLNPLQRLYLEGYLAAKTEELDHPVGSGTTLVAFEIAPGESANQISNNLAAAGLLPDVDLFLNYTRYFGLDSKLEAGQFQLSPTLSVAELAEALTEARGEEIELRFLEGWRIEEMGSYLQEIGAANIDPDEFLSIVRREKAIALNEYEFLASLPPGASLEGFLFPDTYLLSLDADAATLVLTMLDNFSQRVTPSMRQFFGVQGLTVHEATSLASIVQREARVPEERPIMVGVFLNRLRQGMKLQADPTVQYALGYQNASGTWWKSPLNLGDLEFESPYNTYVHPGLPPGPIANPGLAAMQAVAEPDQTGYLYFVVDCTSDLPGAHVFSTTYGDHLTNVERCR
jgi:UPF0755 protein